MTRPSPLCDSHGPRGLFPVLLLVGLLSGMGCTGKNPHFGNGDGGAGSCGTCGANQVCQNGQCQDLPSTCPCPQDSYCDLATNTCKAGCTEDSQCGAGSICDAGTRTCKTGCRMDSQCPNGNICRDNLCQSLCLGDADCRTPGDICDPVTHTCRVGCDMQTGCPTGMVCDPATLTCQSGCTDNTGCPSGEQCDPVSHQCTCAVDPQAGCTAGHKCTTHDFMTTVCDPDGPTRRGNQCVVTGGPDTCVAGDVCSGNGSDAVCRRFCTADGECGTRSYCDVTDGSFKMCTQACSPVYPGSGCPSGLGCYVDDDTNGKDETDCQPEGTAAENGPCMVNSDCKSGLLCVGDGAVSTCLRLCSLTAMPSVCVAPTTCQVIMTALGTPAWTHYGACY